VFQALFTPPIRKPARANSKIAATSLDTAAQ
jgi:hypothetical protein